MDASYSPLSDTVSVFLPAAVAQLLLINRSATNSQYTSLSGNAGLSLLRGKAARAADIAAASRALEREQPENMPLISRAAFNDLRRPTLDETISEAGSDDEEAIPVDEDAAAVAHQQRQQQRFAAAGLNVGQIDELTLLLADTPVRKLRFKDKEAVKAAEAGDKWGSLKLRQQVLALAKLCTTSGPHGSESAWPLLLAEAHYKLAATYADMQCVPQAHDHCNKAIQALPRVPSGETVDEVAAFKQNINVLLGEMLLMASPPKPQAALQYMLKAGQAEELESIRDPGIRVLVAQCHSLLGIAKLHEAHATRAARNALELRVAASSSRLAELSKGTAEYDQLFRKVRDNKNELREEERFERAIIEEAASQLNKATDVLMEVIDEEETRIRAIKDRQAGGEDQGYPALILTLWRLACEVSFKLSLVEGLAGNTKNQLDRLGEIVTADGSYQCVPPSLMASTLKERGAALVARANVTKDAEQRTAYLQQALDTYTQLLQLQDERYSGNPVLSATTRAEALKLIGNVCVALALWTRAQEYYSEAHDLFSAYLGPDSALAIDLEHRMNEVQAYDDG